MPSELEMTPESLRKQREDESKELDQAMQEDLDKWEKEHGPPPGTVNEQQTNRPLEGQEQVAELSQEQSEFGETGKQSMRGHPELAQDEQIQKMRMEIYEIVNKPPEEQSKAWQNYTDSLSDKDMKKTQRFFGIGPGGKTMIFHDPVDGTQHIILNRRSER